MAEKTIRCAIYTRKSTDEGLDQSFNSLDAQREACAAYILSQRHEGWSLNPELYDDGGFSGGNMDRPGLKALIADVQSGRIDVIVVYKVDRLTRSLADFAKMVEVFDAANVSFVSITQAFNTTTSMGRLTLNVLLSFAQFEREVTGERIRDKIAASKKKGMWMGGPLPLGYDVKDRKLLVNEEGAQTVRHIFERYIALGSAELLVAELDQHGIRTRTGSPFCRGGVRHLLSNKIYLGKICHKDKVYDGEHDAIVPQALWDKAQAVRHASITNWIQGRRRHQVSFLSELITDHLNRHVYATHATKKGVRYRYYITHPNAVAKSGQPAVRYSASALEETVITALDDLFSDQATMMNLVCNADAEALQELLNNAATSKSHLRSLPHMQRAVAEKWIAQIRISHDALEMDVRLTDQIIHAIPLRVTKIRSGTDVKLAVAPRLPDAPSRNEQLALLLAEAHKVRVTALASPGMSIDEIAKAANVGRARCARMLKLGFAPHSVVEAVLAGDPEAPTSVAELFAAAEV